MKREFLGPKEPIPGLKQKNVPAIREIGGSGSEYAQPEDPVAWVETAAEARRCAKMGLRGGDLAFKRVTPPLYTHERYPLCRPQGGGGKP